MVSSVRTRGQVNTPANLVPSCKTFPHVRPTLPHVYVCGFQRHASQSSLAAHFALVLWNGKDMLEEYLSPFYLTRRGHIICPERLPACIMQAVHVEVLLRMGGTR